MKYPTDSALQNHYLDSILPHPSFPEPKQFLKNKDFYQPQSFIWNNPHRTSDYMYKFYHGINDKYHEYKEPILKRQIEQDKQSAQMDRIQYLIGFRNKERRKFLSTKQRRQEMQDKLRKSSIKSGASVVSKQYGLSPQSRFQSTAKSKSIQASTHKHKQTDPIAQLKQSYTNGLKNYDSKSNEIINLITNQKEQYHDKIRSEFILRKKTNLSKNSHIYGSMQDS